MQAGQLPVDRWRADTPGCTTQACGVRDHRPDYEHANAVVLGVSPDPVTAVSKFDQKFGLGFPLLAESALPLIHDPNNAAGRDALNVNERTTFVIGPDGKITDVFRNVKPAEHDELVLGALAG